VLRDPYAFPPQFREAAREAASHLSQRGKRPDLAFATVSIRPNGEIEINVWLASMLGHDWPRGGGGMTLVFDPRTHPQGSAPPGRAAE